MEKEEGKTDTDDISHYICMTSSVWGLRWHPGCFMAPQFPAEISHSDFVAFFSNVCRFQAHGMFTATHKKIVFHFEGVSAAVFETHS